MDDPVGVPIDSFCRLSSSPRATAAGCTGKDGAALADASTACEACSGGFFLFRGGCYSTESTAGSEICTKAEGGRCTACKTDNGLFKNPNDAPILGSECILCSDAKGANGVMGVENCNKCTTPGQAGAATCDTCQAGYVKDQTNNECKKCGTGCSACSASNQQECTACLEGKYLDGNTCIDASSCKGAKYPDPKTNKCRQCNAAAEQGGIPECTACTYSSSLQKPVCSNCGNGGKLLRIDLDGTTSCVDDAGCTGGKTHFVINESGKKCLLCNDTTTSSTDANKGIEHCKTCQKTADNQNPTCSACLDGYFFSQGSCSACGANCATCTSAAINDCTACLPGYFLKSEGSSKECVPCDSVDKGGIDGCAECDNQSSTLKCTKCKPNRKSVGTEGTQMTCEEKTCEDDSACGGTAGACEAIVVGGDGSVKYYCSLCGESRLSSPLMAYARVISNRILVLMVSARPVLLATSSTWGAATACRRSLAASCAKPLQMAYAQQQLVSTSRYRGQRPVSSPCWRAGTPSARRWASGRTSGSRTAGRARHRQHYPRPAWHQRSARPATGERCPT